MLNKSEIEYLKGLKNVSKGYDRYQRHSINKKLRKFEQQILPTILNNENTKTLFIELVRRNTNSVRENTNNVLKRNKTDSALFQEEKSKNNKHCTI